MHAVHTQCEVLDVGKYSNPIFDDAVGYNYNQKYRWTYGIDTFQSSP